MTELISPESKVDLNKIPEVKFWAYVIKLSIKKAMEGTYAEMRKNWNWIFGRQDYASSFDNVCSLISIDAKNIKKVFLKRFKEIMTDDKKKILSIFKKKIKDYNDED